MMILVTVKLADIKYGATHGLASPAVTLQQRSQTPQMMQPLLLLWLETLILRLRPFAEITNVGEPIVVIEAMVMVVEIDKIGAVTEIIGTTGIVIGEGEEGDDPMIISLRKPSFHTLCGSHSLPGTILARLGGRTDPNSQNMLVTALVFTLEAISLPQMISWRPCMMNLQTEATRPESVMSGYSF